MSASPAAADDMDQLHQRFCDLPPELYCMIKDFTLAIESDQTITIGNDYHPPVQLQIDSALRRTAGLRYYSTNTFLIKTHDKIRLPKTLSGKFIWDTWSMTDCDNSRYVKSTWLTYLKWKGSLSQEHLHVMQTSARLAVAED